VIHRIQPPHSTRSPSKQTTAWPGATAGCGSSKRTSTSGWGPPLDTTRTLEQVLQAWSIDGSGIGFDRTIISLRLLAGAGQALDSRAQARRVSARLERFKRAEIDCDGVPDIGHAFADELFRVFGLNNRGVELVPVNANKRILALIENARTG
jgi:hypothetical protein